MPGAGQYLQPDRHAGGIAADRQGQPAQPHEVGHYGVAQRLHVGLGVGTFRLQAFQRGRCDGHGGGEHGIHLAHALGSGGAELVEQAAAPHVLPGGHVVGGVNASCHVGVERVFHFGQFGLEEGGQLGGGQAAFLEQLVGFVGVGQLKGDHPRTGGFQLANGLLHGFGNAGAAVVPEEGFRHAEGEVGQLWGGAYP